MMETYANCPFSFFLEHVLKAKPRKRFEIRPADIGTALHKAIEAFSRLVMGGGLDLAGASREEIEAAMAELCAEALEEIYELGVSPRSRYLTVKLNRAAGNAAAEIARQVSGTAFSLDKTEVRFAQDSPYRPVIVGNANSAELRGMIDRIDRASDLKSRALRVIDYKSGATEFDVSKALHGLDLALPLYMKAALENEQGAYGAGLYYFRLFHSPVPIPKEMSEEETWRYVEKKHKMTGLTLEADNDGKTGGKAAEKPPAPSATVDGKEAEKPPGTPIDADRLAALLANSKDKAGKFADAIIAGDMRMSPAVHKHRSPCRYCGYKGVCNFNEAFGANKARYLKTLKIDYLKTGGGSHG
jgi:ATP-dependent helicase/nuclease subunit B